MSDEEVIKLNPQAKSWISGEHKIDYFPWFTRQHPHFYVLSHAKSGQFLSNMTLGTDGEVLGVETHPKYRKQGLARKLWDTALTHHAEEGLPGPKHSKTMTKAGEAWARKVGGALPENIRTSKVNRMRNMLAWD